MRQHPDTTHKKQTTCLALLALLLLALLVLLPAAGKASWDSEFEVVRLPGVRVWASLGIQSGSSKEVSVGGS